MLIKKKLGNHTLFRTKPLLLTPQQENIRREISRRKRERALWRWHRSNARRRGIEFLFSLGEWVKWWEDQLGPNWMQKRGRKVGQYNMSRFNDKGPYAPANVKCQLHEKNAVETQKGVKNRAKAHLWSDERKKRQSIARSGSKNPFFGKHHSEETKAIFSRNATKTLTRLWATEWSGKKKNVI